MAVINYSPKQGVLGTRQQPSMTLAEIAARLSAQENALPTRAIGGVLGLVNQAREYDYPDTALGWASLPAKAVTGIAKGAVDQIGSAMEEAPGAAMGWNDGSENTNLALGLLGGSAVGTAPQGSLRMFAGRNAKTADLDAMARAEKMLADGADRGQVWTDTGWFKDVDGNMKFEIDDSGASLNTTAFKDGMSGDKFLFDKPLGDGLSHGEAYRAYSDLSDIESSMHTNRPKQRGSYHHDPDRISADGPTPDDVKSVALHEMQHAIQNKEGFAVGGNLGTAYMDDKMRSTWGDEIHKLLKPHTEGQFTKLLKASWPEATPQQLKKAYQSYAKDARKAQRDPYHPAAKAAQETAAELIYKRLAGEAEARNVQTRMNYTPEQRRATPPWSTLDVPEDELIVRRK